jgi:hypothetical protein
MPLYTPRTYVQTSSTTLAVDTTTTSVTFVDLLSLTINVTNENSTLIISSCGSVSNTNNAKLIQVRITVDGTSQGGQSLNAISSAIANPFSLVCRSAGISSGSHTVKLQWLTGANTAQCRPVSVGIDTESANLIVQEVLV